MPTGNRTLPDAAEADGFRTDSLSGHDEAWVAGLFRRQMEKLGVECRTIPRDEIQDILVGLDEKPDRKGLKMAVRHWVRVWAIRRLGVGRSLKDLGLAEAMADDAAAFLSEGLASGRGFILTTAQGPTPTWLVTTQWPGTERGAAAELAGLGATSRAVFEGQPNGATLATFFLMRTLWEGVRKWHGNRWTPTLVEAEADAVATAMAAASEGSTDIADFVADLRAMAPVVAISAGKAIKRCAIGSRHQDWTATLLDGFRPVSDTVARMARDRLVIPDPEDLASAAWPHMTSTLPTSEEAAALDAEYRGLARRHDGRPIGEILEGFAKAPMLSVFADRAAEAVERRLGLGAFSTKAAAQ
jgi:hypothetical protein